MNSSAQALDPSVPGRVVSRSTFRQCELRAAWQRGGRALRNGKRMQWERVRNRIGGQEGDDRADSGTERYWLGKNESRAYILTERKSVQLE